MASVRLKAIEFVQRLELIVTNASRLDYTVPLTKCKAVVLADIKRHFQERVDPQGVAWPPIDPRPNRSSIPLQKTKRLMASATGQGEGYYETITTKSLTVGTRLPQAEVHNFGGVFSAKKKKCYAIPLTQEAMNYNPKKSPRFPRKLFKPRGMMVLAESVGKRKKKLKFQYALTPTIQIKAREFMGLSKKAEEKIEDIFVDWWVATVMDKIVGD